MPTVLGQSFSRRELARRVGDFSQLFGVELFAYSDGRERSVRVLRFRTGSGPGFDIMVDRSMDLGGMSFPVCPLAGIRRPVSEALGCTKWMPRTVSAGCARFQA